MTLRQAAFAALALVLSAAAAAQPKPGLFLHYDLTRTDDEARGLHDANGWRRTRLSLDHAPRDGWKLRAQYDFTADAWTDLFLAAPLAGGSLTVGQFKPAFSADALLSDGQSFFTESAVGGAFAPGRRLGAAWTRGGWTLGAYGQALDGRGPDAALVARGIADGDWGDGARWHVGASLASERPQDDRFSISLRPDGGPAQPSWLGSGSLAADRVDRIGLEAGLQRGDWLLLGEHLQARIDTLGGAGRRADGQLVTLAWTVHGDPRKLKGGLFTTPDARPGALGAVELALRYAEVEAPRADGSRRGSDSLALGVNAQVGRYARLQLSRHRHSRDFDDADAALWTLRVQLQY